MEVMQRNDVSTLLLAKEQEAGQRRDTATDMVSSDAVCHLLLQRSSEDEPEVRNSKRGSSIIDS